MSKVLIVEDDRALRMLYETELSEWGYETVLAKDGVEALEKLAADPPDVIVMDVMMPRLDGLETLQKKLETHPNIPVIIHSAYDLFHKDMRSWSAEEYVVKSSDLTHLRNAIRRALSTWPHCENAPDGVKAEPSQTPRT